MNNKFIVGVLVVLTLTVAGLYVQKSGLLGAASGQAHYQKESFLQGLSAGARDQFILSNVGVLVSSAAATFSSLTTTAASTLGGLVTLNAGQLRSSTVSTSTGSATLSVSYLSGYDTVIVNPTGAASAKTLTFFASSTASTWLPTAGDMQETCFLNATGTAATTVVFAAGTGIDLQVATSTGGAGGAMDLTIAAGGTACFKFIRKAATASAFDIEANLTEYSDAD